MSRLQRRKGNAKTASSSQAADLLARSGQTVSFIGFDGGLTNVFETAASSELTLINGIDADSLIIFKKLSKKDPQTREKALRELLNVLKDKDQEMVEICFAYYATIMDKLSLDGSSTVRMLSLKVAGYFISVLKKAAQKNLKSVLPFVLLCTCDISNSVSSQAEAVLNENFPENKKAQAISIFASETASIAVAIISNQHPLILPQKYDDEETTDQRKCRLMVQCLQTLSRLTQFAPTDNEFTEHLYVLFENSTIKHLLKASDNIKSALLGLSLQLPNFASILLESPLSVWIISNLDSSESAICKGAFEAFVHLASDDRFYSKFGLKKSVVPKLLSVVRKKQSYWREVYSYLLPSFSLIVAHIDEEDRTDFVLSFLESFMDNLPFYASNLMENWLIAFAECLKYALCYNTDLSQVIMEPCSRQIIFIFDIIDAESQEVHNIAVDLLMWILDKNIFPEDKVTELLDSLQLNLMNKHTQCNSLLVQLLSSCNWRLRRLHVAVCRVYPLDVDLISPLLNSSDNYLNYMDKELDLVLWLSKCSKLESEVAARVILRLFKINKEKARTIKLTSSPFTRSLFSECSDEDWLYLQSFLMEEKTTILSRIVLDWMLEHNSLSAINLLNRLELAGRRDILSPILSENFDRYHDFFKDILDSVELPTDLTVSISDLLFKCLFNIWLDKDDVSIVTTLSRFPPSNLLVRTILSSVIHQMCSSYDPQIQGKLSTENLRYIGSICSALLQSNANFLELLLTAGELEDILVEYDNYVRCDLVCRYALIMDSSSEEADCGKNNISNSKDTLLELLESTARRVLIYLSIDSEEPCLDYSFALSLVHLFMTEFIINSQLAFVSPSEIVTASLDKCREMLQHQHFGSQAISGLLCIPSVTRSGMFILRRLKELERPDFQLSSCISSEHRVPIFWALQTNCTEVSMNIVDKWINRFHCGSSAKDFLNQLRENVELKDSEWNGFVFSVRSLSSDLWRLNLVCLRAACDALHLTMSSEITTDLMDFIMCGLVTALDSCDEQIEERANDWRFDCFASLSLKLFSRCAKIAISTENDAFKKEWGEFFYPTLSRIVVRWYSFLKPNEEETLFIRSLSHAVHFISEIGSDLSVTFCFSPELDYFQYGAVYQTLIIQTEDLLLSSNPFMQFAALHMLRILSPTMYHQENGQWAEDDKVSSSGPRRLKVPFTLSRIATETKGWPAIMALDAAIVPLMTSIFFDEERVAYCDALLTIIQTVLPQLISRCPSTVPKSMERDYFMSQNYIPSIDSFSRYASNMLYRTMGAVPAVIRTWYNGLPNTGAQLVNKYVKRYVSKLLVEAELSKVKTANQEQLKGDKLLKIRVVPASREVIADYTVEETKMRLSIEMPDDWPLSVPSIQLDKAIVPSERAKKWLLQLTAYLFHQNGSTVEGLMMWRKNVDRDVEGAEACTICMMTIHSSSHQLPKVKCRQCKNKFHSNCLYKWFESSSQSSCPLCRGNFT